MNQRYFQTDQWLGAARNALKPRLLTTMVLSISLAVVLYGIFSLGGKATFTAIIAHFVGGMAFLITLLFGLTALAHQLQCQLNDAFVPNTIEACRFAWGRAKSILMLPVWGAGLLLTLILAEMVVLGLANIPGLGLVWLALIGVPLLLLNTVVAVALMLALFNIAARVAIANTDATSLKNDLWRLIKKRLPELLVYNLGGVLVTLFVATLLLSPLWLGAQMTLGLVEYAAQEPFAHASDATGFWGSIAHLIGLIMAGLLFSAVVSVPGVVITQMTLLVHLELASEEPSNDPEESETKESSSAEERASVEEKGRKTARKRPPARKKKETKSAMESKDEQSA